MCLPRVITLSVLMLGLWSCSPEGDKNHKKPVNSAEEVEEEEEVADRDQKPDLTTEIEPKFGNTNRTRVAMAIASGMMNPVTAVVIPLKIITTGIGASKN